VDIASGVVTDPAGNAYAVGTFSDTLILPKANLTSTGATNAFIVAFDDNLNELWGDRFGSSNQGVNPDKDQTRVDADLNLQVGDDGDAVGIDGANNIYISGEDEGLSSYGTSTTPVVGQNSNNVEAYVIAVSSSTGGLISNDAVGATGSGNSASEAESLAVDPQGDVAGTGPITTPITLGTQTISSAKDFAFIANLSGGTTTTSGFDLAITNTDGTSTFTPGGTTTYKIVVTNNGPDDVTGAAVNDTLPTDITSNTWTAVTSSGASVTTTSGSGSIKNDSVDLPKDATVTFTVVCQISSSATGKLTDTATVGTTATTPAGVTDNIPANNTATDTDTPTSSTSAFDLAITNTDGTSTYTAGGSTTYKIEVSNAGPSAVTGAAVNDSLPGSITSDSWTAVASKGATVKTAKGTGSITNDLVDIPLNATVTFTVVAQISSSATRNLVNTATVATTATAPKGVTDSNSSNNTASVTLTATKSPSSTPTPTPTSTSTPKSTPVAPVFTGEQRIYSGKGKKKKVTGIEFQFKSALSAGSAQSTGNYHVTQKISKKKTKTLAVTSATYSNDTVTIGIGGFQNGKPTQAMIVGLVGANGAPISQISTSV
jgi:uncharacterized repeat protein (TIGR01451 family)